MDKSNSVFSGKKKKQVSIIKLVLGVLFLLFGRRLLIFYIGGLGFILGLSYADKLFIGPQPEWVLLLISVLVGLVGAGLALFLQRLAIFSGGFIAGGYLLWSIMAVISKTPPLTPLVSFLIGGFLGGILLSLLFKWTLVVLSSLTGSFLIVQSIQPVQTISQLNLPEQVLPLQSLPIMLIIFIVLSIIGIAVQGIRLKRK